MPRNRLRRHDRGAPAGTRGSARRRNRAGGEFAPRAGHT